MTDERFRIYNRPPEDIRVSRPDALEAALSLAANGFSVFPMDITSEEWGAGATAKTKHFICSWSQAATTDPEVIVEWWTGDAAGAWPAIYTGKSDLLVLDVDRKHGKNGVKSMKKAGRKAPKTFSYTTLNNGIHHWYRAPQDRAATVGQDVDGLVGVDVRAGVGLVVYYGPILEDAPEMAEAPEWSIVESQARDDRAPMLGVREWMEAVEDGKPTDEAKAILKRLRKGGVSHQDLLTIVADLVRIGTDGKPGARKALAKARDWYVNGTPGGGRVTWNRRKAATDFDVALEGSVRRQGLPLDALPIPKSYMRQVANRRLPVAPERRDPSQPRALEHSPLAEEIAAVMGKKWAHVEGIGILRYRAGVWRVTDRMIFDEHVRRALLPIIEQEGGKAIGMGDNKRVKEVSVLANSGSIRSVAGLALGILADLGGEVDAYPDLLNVKNGVVDLRTGELLPHDPAYMFTKQAPVAYDPDAYDEYWDRALEALPDRKTAKWLQTVLGQAITGHNHTGFGIPFLKGGGENAKSTILDALRTTCGTGQFGYVATVPDRLLLGSPNDHPTDITTLHRVRVAIAEELPEGRHLNVKRLKDIVDTRTLSGRRMREDFFEWTATHTFIVSTNYTPAVAETDHGTWRRLTLVPFPWKFTLTPDPDKPYERLADPAIKAHFEEHPSPGLLSWLVKGSIRWYASGRKVGSTPMKVQRATDDWRDSADPIRAFAAERLAVNPGYAIPSRDFCEEFREYLKASGRAVWADETIVARALGHDALPGVEKRQVRFTGGNLQASTRPGFFPTAQAAPARAHSFVGVRFRETPGDLVDGDVDYEDALARMDAELSAA